MRWTDHRHRPRPQLQCHNLRCRLVVRCRAQWTVPVRGLLRQACTSTSAATADHHRSPPYPPAARGLLSMIWGNSGQKSRRDDGAVVEPLPAYATSSAFPSSISSPSALAAPSTFSSLSSAFSPSASASTSASSGGSSPSSRDVIETLVIKSLISSYFLIVQKNVCDFIPKAIMHHIVNHSKTNMQSAVVGELLVKGGQRVGGLDELMREGEDVAEKRRGCEELIGILEKAMDIVNQARNYQSA